MLLLATNRTAKVLWHFRIRIWPGSVANVFSELHVNQLQQERLAPRHGKDLFPPLAQPLVKRHAATAPWSPNSIIRQDKLWYKVIEIIHAYTLNSQLVCFKGSQSLVFSMAYFYDSMCISPSLGKKKGVRDKPAKRPGRTQYLRS